MSKEIIDEIEDGFDPKKVTKKQNLIETGQNGLRSSYPFLSPSLEMEDGKIEDKDNHILDALSRNRML